MTGHFFSASRIVLTAALCLATGITVGASELFDESSDESEPKVLVAEASIPVASPAPPTSALGSQRSFIKAIPDFTQTHIKGSDHGQGRMYCGPVAVSNSLAWLNGDTRDDQYALILKLASSDYMDTSPWDGTGVRDFLNGVHRYATETYGGYARLRFQGWRRHPKEFSAGRSVPDLDWLAQGITEDSAVWINVGWYTYDRASDAYTRKSGHWVTLAGYDFENSNALIVHDPAPRAGHGFSNEHVIPKRIDGGTLQGDFNNLPRPAKGYYTLVGGMHIKRRADYAIMDGAVVFER